VNEIRALAERAIALAPHLGEPWLALATLSYVTSDWPAAVQTLREALRRAPGLLKAHDMLGHIEIEVGRIDEGLFRLENVLSLDPSPSAARWMAMSAHALRRRWDRTDELLALPIEDEPDRVMHSFACARMDLQRGVAIHPVVSEAEAAKSRHLFVARAMGLSIQGILMDDVAAAVAGRVAETPKGSRMRPLLLQLLAEIHARAGRHAAALEYVTNAVEAGLFDLAWLSEAPVLDPLRRHSSWPALRARVEERVAPILRALDAPLA
jgi:serine/threonine-protein kinase